MEGQKQTFLIEFTGDFKRDFNMDSKGYSACTTKGLQKALEKASPFNRVPGLQKELRRDLHMWTYSNSSKGTSERTSKKLDNAAPFNGCHF